MTINRRTFLNRAALGVAATSLSGLACNSSAQTAQPTQPGAPTPAPGGPTPAPTTGADAAAAIPNVSSTSTWEEIRAQFTLAPDYIHMSALLMAAHPAPVRRAIEAYRRALDENPALYLEQDFKFVTLEQVARESAAKYLDTQAELIAMTDSTTMGLGLIYGGLQLKAGDDVITTPHDHYSTHEGLRYATERAGATLRRVPMYQRGDDATAEGMVAALVKAIRPKTRVVAITWVHSGTGVKTPVAAIGEAIAAENARRPPANQILFCVDAVHGFGAHDVVAADFRCDFLITGCHKWLFGPRGTGLVWGNARAWERVLPLIPSFQAPTILPYLKGERPTNVPGGFLITAGGFHSFEHRWALHEAFEFNLAIGKGRIQARTEELSTQVKRGLAEMRHVRVITPMDPAISAGITCFEVEGMAPEAVLAALLEKRIVASTGPYVPTYARLTPCIYNSSEDVETSLRAIRELA